MLEKVFYLLLFVLSGDLVTRLGERKTRSVSGRLPGRLAKMMQCAKLVSHELD